MLARAGGKPLSGGAITNWKARGSIPDKHLRRLIEMFGPTSHLAKLYPDLIKITVRGEQIAVARGIKEDDDQGEHRVEEERAHYGTARSAQSAELARLRHLASLWVTQTPDNLKGNIDVPLRLSGESRRIDYLSDTLAAEVAWMPRMLGPRDFPYHAVVLLAGLRNTRHEPGRQYVIVLMKRPPMPEGLNVFPEPSGIQRQRMLNLFVVDCVNVGVMPLLDVAPEDVAETIAALHHHRLDLEADYDAPGEYADLL